MRIHAVRSWLDFAVTKSKIFRRKIYFCREQISKHSQTYICITSFFKGYNSGFFLILINFPAYVPVSDSHYGSGSGSRRAKSIRIRIHNTVIQARKSFGMEQGVLPLPLSCSSENSPLTLIQPYKEQRSLKQRIRKMLSGMESSAAVLEMQPKYISLSIRNQEGKN